MENMHFLEYVRFGLIETMIAMVKEIIKFVSNLDPATTKIYLIYVHNT